jgi:hypothetical protein
MRCEPRLRRAFLHFRFCALACDRALALGDDAMTDGTPPDTINSLKGLIPESWLCIDCGMNTAPGLMTRAEAETRIARENNQTSRLDANVPESRAG